MSARERAPSLSARDAGEGLNADESGQLVVEWVLVTTAVLILVSLTLPVAFELLLTGFNRLQNTIPLPFP